MVFTEESTTAAFLLRARREGLRDFGACMAPLTAFQILQGIETLPLRMAAPRREHAQGRRVPGRASDGRVGRLSGAPGHPDHALAQALLPRGCGAVFSFDLRGTRAQGRSSSSR